MNPWENPSVKPVRGEESPAHGYQDQIAAIVTSIIHDPTPNGEGQLIRVLGMFFEDFTYGIINPRIAHRLPEEAIELPEFLSLLREGVQQVAEKRNLQELILTIEDPSSDIPRTLYSKIKGVIQSDDVLQQPLEEAIQKMEKDGQTLSEVLKRYRTSEI